MCVCERIAAGGERVSPSIHKCANPMRDLKPISESPTLTTTTPNTINTNAVSTSPSADIINTNATLTSISSTPDSNMAINTRKNNLKNHLITSSNNVASNNNLINSPNNNNNNNLNSTISCNTNNNNNISIVNTKNNINSNSNNKLTNVMDKLDPSLHCFLSPSLVSLYSFSNSFSSPVNEELEPTSSEIAKRIEDFLKTKKIIRNSTDLPANLTKKVAQDIIGMSETEPCGLQGCLLYIMLEDEDHKSQTIGTLKLGEKTIVPTFVVYLHLRRQYSDWLKFIAARFLRNLFRDSSYTINDIYKLYKRKLFRNLDPLLS